MENDSNGKDLFIIHIIAFASAQVMAILAKCLYPDAISWWFALSPSIVVGIMLFAYVIALVVGTMIWMLGTRNSNEDEYGRNEED